MPPGVPLLVFATGVVTLALTTLVATLAPGMWVWGLSSARFVPTPWRWLWLLPLVALLPPLERPLVGVAGRIGRSLAGRWGGPLAFAVAAMVAFGFADQIWFTGDFLQRLSTIELNAPVGNNYIGAMPIDWLLHAALPRLLLADPGTQAIVWLRSLGAIECGLLALGARAWARSLGLTGAELTAGTMLVILTGALAMFTGLGKPAGLMCVVAVATLVTGVQVARGAGGTARFGALVALGLLVHRSGVLLLPAWATASALAIAHERTRGRARWLRLAPLALPVPVVAVAWRRLVSLTLFYDLPHHLNPRGSVTGQFVAGGWLGTLHLVDVANAVLLLAPAFVLMLPVAAMTGPPAWRDPGERFRLSLVVPALLVVTLVFPQQGIFRDLDVFAPWTLLLEAIAVGALVARLPKGGARPAWLVRAALVVAAPGLALVATFADPDAGLTRVRAFVSGPPHRDAATRSLGWDFLIGPYVRRGRLDDAAACLREAIALAPHRRLFLTWALIEARRGHPDQVAVAYGDMTRRWPDDAIGWYGLVGARLALGDTAGRDSALTRLAALVGDPGKRAELARYRAEFPETWPGPPALLDTLLTGAARTTSR
ncbi:MAG: tetratricopeptide repeat protein [Candidatus Eisenbacteria bacterium]